jgi:flagellar assembly factor FliW
MGLAKGQSNFANHMTSATENFLPTTENETQFITLPLGLMGLPELKEFEITKLTRCHPFLRLASLGELHLEFLIVEPGEVVNDYAFVLEDEHAEALGLERAEDVLILNVVTLHSQEPSYITVNLAGPIIINRQTGIGRQVVLPREPRHYSASHVLMDERQHAVAA